MDYFNLFILIIVLLVLVYILYYFFLSTKTTVNSNLLNLNAAVQPYNKVASPAGVRYAYGVWVYVNNLNDVNNTIIGRAGNFRLWIDKTAPILNCDFAMSGNGGTQTTAITNNFPLQKWSFIVISVDNLFVDYYINGKLVKSEKKQLMMKTPPDANTPLYFGNNPFYPFDAYLGKVIRWTNPVDPQTAWSTYLNGNGMGSTMMPYHANLSIIKDNIQTATYNLW